MRDTGGVVDAEQSTLQLVMDQAEELIVTLIEEIRERPGVAAAIVAAVVGVIVGSLLASATRRRSPPRRAAKTARRSFRLASIVWRLMQNPIVRGLVLAQLRRRVLSAK
jgi:hypothetical protein